VKSAVDIEKLRVALRRLSRANLLIVAERAIEIVPRTKLPALVGDLLRLEEIAKTKRGAAPLLEEVRKFHDAGMRGEYYDSFRVNSRNFMEQSEGTQELIAEFGRLMDKCVRAAAEGPFAPVREAFDLLFALLRRIDEDPDSVVFFADEAGSWQLGVDFRTVLPAYYRCLAEGTPPEDFAREVNRTISSFAVHERPHHLAAARRVASAEQKAALRRSSPGEKRLSHIKGGHPRSR
jgi:hypothetical protein